jgi:amino acid transporter
MIYAPDTFHEYSESVRSHHRPAGMKTAKNLGFWPLVASTYFMVCGGPYGIEDLVGQGYTVALIALAATPWIWSLPTAVMVGELASAIPEEGGYYAWVRRGLGPFWAVQEAWLSLVASIFDMAIYPTLFMTYLGRFVPGLAGPWALGAGVVVIAFGLAWNVRGAASVGRSAVVLGFVVLAPFAGLVALSFMHFSCGHPCRGPSGSIAHVARAPSMEDVGAGVLVALWNYMGWDNASTIANEVARPARVYPRAILVTLVLVTATYLLPVAAAAVAGIDPRGWTAGAWVEAARAVGGAPLAALVVAGGMSCGVGMFNALLLSYSRVPAALAEDGYLPAFLGRRRPRSGVPWAAVAACSVAYALCLGLGFRHLVALDVLLYGLSLVLEFAALVALRLREPALERPFKAPGGAVAAALLGVPPAALLGVAAWACHEERIGSIPALALGGLLVALGVVGYPLRRPRTAVSR